MLYSPAKVLLKGLQFYLKSSQRTVSSQVSVMGRFSADSPKTPHPVLRYFHTDMTNISTRIIDDHSVIHKRRRFIPCGFCLRSPTLTPRPYLTFIVGTDHSVLAVWQQYRPIGAVWLRLNSPECRCNFRVSPSRLR